MIRNLDWEGGKKEETKSRRRRCFLSLSFPFQLWEHLPTPLDGVQSIRSTSTITTTLLFNLWLPNWNFIRFSRSTWSTNSFKPFSLPLSLPSLDLLSWSYLMWVELVDLLSGESNEITNPSTLDLAKSFIKQVSLTPSIPPLTHHSADALFPTKRQNRIADTLPSTSLSKLLDSLLSGWVPLSLSSLLQIQLMKWGCLRVLDRDWSNETIGESIRPHWIQISQGCFGMLRVPRHVVCQYWWEVTYGRSSGRDRRWSRR